MADADKLLRCDAKGSSGVSGFGSGSHTLFGEAEQFDSESDPVRLLTDTEAASDASETLASSSLDVSGTCDIAKT